MASSSELIVPDIGDFTDIPVIEVFVKAGDTVAKDAPLITLESDKATLDVPVEVPGTIVEMKVKVGDRVSQGTVIAIISGAPTKATGDVVAAVTDSTAAQGAGVDAPGNTGSGLSGGSAASSAGAESSSAPAQATASTSSTTQNIVVPDIGDFTDIPVIEIFVKPGDTITKDAPIMTLESDKATLDIPAPFDGVIAELRVAVGAKVSAGTVIATATTAGAAAPAPVASAPKSAPPSGAAQPAASVPASYGANGSSGAKGGSGSNGAATNGTMATTASAVATMPGSPVHSSPSIRRFARELGVSLAEVKGTGPNGRIRRDDVQNWVKRALSSGVSAGAASNAGGTTGGMSVLPWPKVDFAAFGEIERVTLSRIKKLSGPNLHRNWVMIPHVTQFDEADITDLEAMRKAINAEQDVKVTMLAFMIVACVAALKKYPDVNSSLEGDELIRKKYYHIGFAADTPNGLVVPVIRDADRKGVLEVAKETSALAKKARDGKLTGADMQGGTFTISSLGGIGGTAFTPIINAPEVAILGVSKSSLKPVWDGKAFAPRLMLPLSLSYDHRVIDGASAARFCATLAQTLADLRRALL